MYYPRDFTTDFDEIFKIKSSISPIKDYRITQISDLKRGVFFNNGPGTGI